jgi:hypothetical protein
MYKQHEATPHEGVTSRSCDTSLGANTHGHPSSQKQLKIQLLEKKRLNNLDVQHAPYIEHAPPLK